MQYNVAQLLKEPTGATRSVELNQGPESRGGYSPDGLAGRMQFLRTHQGLLVRGNVKARVSLTCSRCLNEFVDAAQLDLEEEFFPRVDVNTGQRMPLPSDTEGTIIDVNHVLDLTEVLRQYVIAAQPIKPLCRADCSGLCQECGVDLNKENCTCGEGTRDPRWAGLAALLRESEA